MPERDYLVYEDWERAGGIEGTGQQAPPQQTGGTTMAPVRNWTDPDNAPPDWLYNPNQHPPGDPGPGNYWAWDGSMWIIRQSVRPPTPTTTTPTTTTPVPPAPRPPGPNENPGTFSGGSFDYGSFAWPTFNAPRYQPGAPFQAPAPFSFEEFKQPEFGSIYDDGSYVGRRDEGLKGIANAAAAKGLTRLPATVKALAAWNQDFASREYGNIVDRAANTWRMNRDNAADNYSRNYGISRDVWDRGEQQNLNAFDRNYKAAYDEFDFNQWKPATLTFDDMYRRWRDTLDANTRIATAYPD